MNQRCLNSIQPWQRKANPSRDRAKRQEDIIEQLKAELYKTSDVMLCCFYRAKPPASAEGKSILCVE